MPVSAWLYYFYVPDLNASIAKAKELGATVMYGPQEIPGGGNNGTRWRVVSGTSPQDVWLTGTTYFIAYKAGGARLAIDAALYAILLLAMGAVKLRDVRGFARLLLDRGFRPASA